MGKFSLAKVHERRKISEQIRYAIGCEDIENCYAVSYKPSEGYKYILQNNEDDNIIFQKQVQPVVTPASDEETIVKQEYGAEKVVRISNKPYVIIAQRKNNDVLFDRTFSDYEEFFGDINNFWIGLEMLAHYTNLAKSRNFRVEFTGLISGSNSGSYFDYQSTYVKSKANNYELVLGSFRSSTLPSSWHFLNDSINNCPFSAKDNDFTSGCPSEFGYGFWFKNCSSFRLFDMSNDITIHAGDEVLTAGSVRILMELKT
ncbi:hypothetical protein SNEBB_010109 [Seison nebaliae]|nr:hypothetical protein SNEBB_010109 [Seison nebaliae]